LRHREEINFMMELKNFMHTNADKSIVQMCFLCPDVFGDVTADSL